MIILICTTTLVFTFLGGWFALRLRDKLYLILSFSAGAVIGVAFFDLLPAAMELAGKFYTARAIAATVGLGFIAYYILDVGIMSINAFAGSKSHSGLRGNVAAFCLSLHSYLDGITIGLAFKVSYRMGLLIALAVIIHDMADGINTTSAIMKGGGKHRTAVTWLAINSVAPILGAASTLFIRPADATLGILLALVTGFFLYLGTSDMIPKSTPHHPRLQMLMMSLLGVGVIFIALRIAAAF